MSVRRPGKGPVHARPEVATVTGMVIRTEAGFHRVLIPGGRVVVARAPKRLLLGERLTTTAVVIGDRVRVQEREDGVGVVEEILPRDNELVRGAAGGSRYLDVIAANLDELVAVHSLAEPEFVPARLDRFVLIAEAAEIPAIVCLNKLDLVPPDMAEEIAAPYIAAGYPTVLTSIKTGAGVDAFRELLVGRTSALIGPSGVGKSSLLNAVQPGLRLRTGEISESTGKGRHTTTTAEMLALDGGGWVADTPGLRELAIRDVDAINLDALFPEFAPYVGACRFSSCTHRDESGCRVRAAVEDGEVSEVRYETYLRIFEQLLEEEDNKY
jgi:ribosome biogenesis GTPase / thiamine phosphate phosphatase